MEALKTDALIVSALDEVLHFFLFLFKKKCSTSGRAHRVGARRGAAFFFFATASCYCTTLRFFLNLNFTTAFRWRGCSMCAGATFPTTPVLSLLALLVQKYKFRWRGCSMCAGANVPYNPGTQFTCFTGTKVPILTQQTAVDELVVVAYALCHCILRLYLYFCASKASKLSTGA
jgi:hypothetical protein